MEVWPKLFQNLRSTRETELAEELPMHVVCSWIGNSKAVAAKHSLQTTDDHFRKTTQNSTQTVRDNGVYDGQSPPETPRKSLSDNAGQLVACGKVVEEGLEQSANTPGKTVLVQRGRAKSDVNKPPLQRLANNQRPFGTKRRRARAIGHAETDLALALVTSTARGYFGEDVSRTACNSFEVVDIKRVAIRMTRGPTTLLPAGV